MRIYLPATLPDLATLLTLGELPPRVAHAVTPALRAALPDEDDEGLEFSAQLTAADDALALLTGNAEAPPRRLVLAADVPPAALAPAEDPDAAVTAVQLAGPVGREAVVAAHVDEVEAMDDVRAALGGDAEAGERLVERDLLWYDASELAVLAQQARGA